MATLLPLPSSAYFNADDDLVIPADLASNTLELFYDGAFAISTAGLGGGAGGASFDPSYLNSITRLGTPTDPLAPWSAIPATYAFNGYTADGLKGFNTFDDTQLAGASSILVNARRSTITGLTTPGEATIFGQGNTLNLEDGATLVLEGLAGSPQSTILKDLKLTASGSGYVSIDASNAALTPATGPRIENGSVTAPIRFVGKGIVLLINCQVTSITNDQTAASQLATVYTVGAVKIGAVGANVKVESLGGSGTPGTARDPYDVNTAKRKEVVDANVPAYVETDEAYYGKEFVDEVYGPGQPAYYKCIPSAPAMTGGATVWKWFRSDIL